MGATYESAEMNGHDMKHYPMTKEQRETFDHDLAAIMTGLSDVATLLGACFGDKDPRHVRAKEAEAALQRLLWALEREAEPLRPEIWLSRCVLKEWSGQGATEQSEACSSSIGG